MDPCKDTLLMRTFVVTIDVTLQAETEGVSRMLQATLADREVVRDAAQNAAHSFAEHMAHYLDLPLSCIRWDALEVDYA
jgi:hypothetical protein